MAHQGWPTIVNVGPSEPEDAKAAPTPIDVTAPPQVEVQPPLVKPSQELSKIKEPIPDLNAPADDDVMEISPHKFKPRKRRAPKVIEQLDERFLRRSKRNALKLDGFKKVPVQEREPLEPQPQPLAIIPAPTVAKATAPHVTQNLMSASLLEKEVNDDES